ncbi:uncharacterized protein [Nicotiana sylvestris]|uniref:uncharacterized protein n=1 Tax=Nicotiana sylvestris TaxID=4096 RepID=UPI00388C90E7
MRQVLMLHTTSTSTNRTIAFSSISMVVHKVGNGYRRTTTAGTWPGRSNEQSDYTKYQEEIRTTKCKCLEELPRVPWAYQTTTKSSKGETPFCLVYGAEALISVEVGEPTLRYFQASEGTQNEVMLVNLELLDERKDLEHIRMAAQNQRVERYYNRRANLCYFKVGDLVLRKVTQNTRELNVGKLGPTWEGRYRVSTITEKGSYELENQDEEKLPRN